MKSCIIVTLLLVSVSHAYDPPEIIFSITNRSVAPCNVGDQNEDGYDDLMLKVNDSEVLLFHGGVPMDTVPDLTIEPDTEGDRIGYYLSYYGKLSDDHSGCFGWWRIRADGNDYDLYTDILYGGEEIDGQVDLSIHGSSTDNDFKVPGIGYMTGPYDLNNDGYNDVILADQGGNDYTNLWFYSMEARRSILRSTGDIHRVSPLTKELPIWLYLVVMT